MLLSLYGHPNFDKNLWSMKYCKKQKNDQIRSTEI